MPAVQLRGTYIVEVTGRQMGKRRDYHVVPSPRGGWTIRREGAEGTSGHFDRKSDAMDRGRDLAREHRSELIEHGKDGRIRDRASYGKDAHPPKGGSHSAAPKGYGALRGKFALRADVDTTRPIYEQSTRSRKAR